MFGVQIYHNITTATISILQEVNDTYKDLPFSNFTTSKDSPQLEKDDLQVSLYNFTTPKDSPQLEKDDLRVSLIQQNTINYSKFTIFHSLYMFLD